MAFTGKKQQRRSKRKKKTVSLNRGMFVFSLHFKLAFRIVWFVDHALRIPGLIKRLWNQVIIWFNGG